MLSRLAPLRLLSSTAFCVPTMARAGNGPSLRRSNISIMSRNFSVMNRTADEFPNLTLIFVHVTEGKPLFNGLLAADSPRTIDGCTRRSSTASA